MSYTLKLDWDDDRIWIVREVLAMYIAMATSLATHEGLPAFQIEALLAGAAEARAALQDIRLYADEREKVKRGDYDH